MSQNKLNKSNLLKYFAGSLKLQWQLTGWRSFITPAIDVIRNLLSIAQAYIFAQIINLLTNFVGAKVDTVYPLFWYYVAALLLIELLEPSVRTLGEHYEDKLRVYSGNKFSRIVVGKISELDAAYFENSKYNDLVYRVTSLNASWVLRSLSSIISDIITFLIAAAAVLSLNWIIFVLALIATLPRMFAAVISNRSGRNLYKALSEKKRLKAHLKDYLSSWDYIKELRPYNAVKSFLDKLSELQKQIAQTELKQRKKYAILELITDIIAVLTSVATRVWLFLKIISSKGVFGIGNFVFYNALIGKMEASSGSLVRNFSEVFDDLLNIEDYFVLMSLEPHIKPAANPKKIDPIKPPAIEFKNVSFTYPGKSKAVLKDVSFKLEAGQKMALIGVNGAGKTTLTKLLLRYYDPNEGEIFVNGTNLNEIDLKSWYDNLAVVQQDFNKYPISAKENINLQLDTKTDTRKLGAAIKNAQADFVYELKDKADTILTRSFDDSTELSGGQWQKIALARAFYKNAPFLIMDEPTSAIDARSEAEIFNNLWRVQKKKSALVISHRFSTVREADLIVVIEKGRVIEQGTHEQLMKNKKVYHELFVKQAKSYR